MSDKSIHMRATLSSNYYSEKDNLRRGVGGGMGAGVGTHFGSLSHKDPAAIKRELIIEV